MRKLCLFLMTLSVGCNSNKTAWNGLSVELRTNETESALVFKEGARTVFTFEMTRPPHQTGTLSVPGASLYWATAFSGGESGCCENIHIFHKTGGTVMVQTLEKSGYSGSFEVMDLAPADGFAEIVSVSEEFYGKDFAGCRVTPGLHEGMSDLHVPEFWKPVTQGGFHLENVTFAPAYAAELKTRLEHLASRIEALPAELEAPGADVAALLQYRETRKKAGLPPDAKLDRFRVKCETKTIPFSALTAK
jgi:hypothetical protein